MKHNNKMLAQIGSEVEAIIDPQRTIDEAESARYWTDYRAEIMKQLLDGNIDVPEGSTADRVVDAHVAKVRSMCEMFGDGLPLERKLIEPSGESNGFLSSPLSPRTRH